MATKTISISEEERSLLDVAGVLSKEEAEEMRSHVKDRREKTREQMESQLKEE